MLIVLGCEDIEEDYVYWFCPVCDYNNSSYSFGVDTCRECKIEILVNNPEDLYEED